MKFHTFFIYERNLFVDNADSKISCGWDQIYGNKLLTLSTKLQGKCRDLCLQLQFFKKEVNTTNYTKLLDKIDNFEQQKNWKQSIDNQN